MRTLGEALTTYVTVRRTLGTQLREPAVTLRHFVDFLERQGAAYITTELALRWAMAPVGVQHGTWTRRLTHVRQFAMWLQATSRARRSRRPASCRGNGAGHNRTSLPIQN